MHSLFFTYKTAILPVFEQLLRHFTNLISRDRPWPDRQWALCVFDDLLEHAGPASQAYQEFFLARMIESLGDSQGEIRQASAYGVGVMAQFGGAGYTAACAQALPALIDVIERPESRAVENLSPTENAISAVAKICKYNGAAVGDIGAMIARWMSWLPVWDDDDEAVHVYGYLCDLVEANHPAVLGLNNSNIPAIIGIIAEVFHREVFSSTDESGTRLLNIVRQVQGNQAIFSACIAQMATDRQTALSEALSAAAAAAVY